MGNGCTETVRELIAIVQEFALFMINYLPSPENSRASIKKPGFFV
ncbi:hypothetical protein MC7420_2230 [Coleofasciculus chthonoplastes PCC 7420]|uniref:Uncharacterized protein n=1 Tax=Coleofasciculus chthonoplastes PCC 7420 TaxID=118168 RepID=B4VRZ1_9CYAN|nr:hypothetical protein MC7420_2230 [Coleofasciculus chthonoplastes PCC 7420]